LQEGNSTKQGPNGLGLYLLQDFVRVNGGSLQILANTGHYHQKEAILDITDKIEHPFTFIERG